MITSPSLWYPIQHCIGTTFCGFWKHYNTVFVYSNSQDGNSWWKQAQIRLHPFEGTSSAVSKTQLPTKGTTGQRREHASAAYFRYPRPRLHLTSLNQQSHNWQNLANIKLECLNVNTTLNSNGSFFHCHIMFFFAGFKPNKEKIIMKQFHVGKKNVHAVFSSQVDWHTLAIFPKNLPCAL